MFGRRKKPKQVDQNDVEYLATEAELRKIKIDKREKNDNKYLANEAELKKIKIVERDITPPSIMKNRLLLKSQQDKLTQIRKNTSDLMHRIVYFNNKINEKANRLEVRREQAKIQKILKNIEKKDKELNKISDGAK